MKVIPVKSIQDEISLYNNSGIEATVESSISEIIDKVQVKPLKQLNKYGTIRSWALLFFKKSHETRKLVDTTKDSTSVITKNATAISITSFIFFLLLICTCMFVILRFVEFDLPGCRFPKPTIAPKDPHALNVVLYGDSLINRPFTMFDLGHYLSKEVETFYHHINIYNRGFNGENIDRLTYELPHVKAASPHAVILQWDSDLSYLPMSTLLTERDELQSAYVARLESVVIELLSAGVEYLAISSPLLFGEHDFLRKRQFRGRDEIIEEYIELNAYVAAKYNCTFINMHKHFEAVIPETWVFAFFYVTMDGEHPNRYGSQIIAKVFGKHLQDWLQTRERTPR